MLRTISEYMRSMVLMGYIEEGLEAEVCLEEEAVCWSVAPLWWESGPRSVVGGADILQAGEELRTQAQIPKTSPPAVVPRFTSRLAEDRRQKYLHGLRYPAETAASAETRNS